MSDYYDIRGKSYFTILSISNFWKPQYQRDNAAADASVMRNALKQLGMKEFSARLGNQRKITRSQAMSHFKYMGKNLSKCNLVVVVIASHGEVAQNIQRWGNKGYHLLSL